MTLMQRDKMMLVSIAMGIRYHREDLFFLERSISSILNQTYGELELLICENGSTPEARACIDRFAAEDARIRLIKGENAIYLSEKLNRCLAAAKGQWIARMDDDDFSAPERLARQIIYLQTHPEIGFVGCAAQLEQHGQPAGLRQPPERPVVQDFYMTQPYLHPTLMFRREILEAVGGYSEDKYCDLCEDYDLLLRIYTRGYIGANLQEILFTYTLPTTAKGSRKMRHRWNETVIRWRRFRELKLLPSALFWVVKPLFVGLLPERVLSTVKAAKVKRTDHHHD